MLSSLPVLVPRDAHTLWYTPTTTHPSTSTPNNATTNPNNTTNATTSPPPTPHLPFSTHPHAQHRPRPTSTSTPRTLLTALLADEALIASRKLNIRRFGAAWIRPPGISKTLQGLQDEVAEREEHEVAQARELAALEEAQVAAQLGGGDEMEGVEGEERDLDGDVPDGDAEEEEEEDGFEEEGEGEGWEDEMGGEGVGLELEMEMGDLEGGDEGRDLDADVPEAGSYARSDTEVEGGSSDGEDWIGPSMRTAGRPVAVGGRAEGGRQGLLPGQAQGSSGAVGGAAVGSSPVALGGRRSGNFAGRLRGREN